MDIHSAFLKFKKKDGTTFLVSVCDLLDTGNPIDEDDGDDLKLVDENLYRFNGEQLKLKV